MLRKFIEKNNHLKFIILNKNKKTPLNKMWLVNVEKKEDILKAIEEGYNIGFLVDEDMLVLDVDERNGGLKSFRLFKEKYLNNKMTRTVLTPGGFHLYFKVNRKMNLKKSLKDYPGIDFLSGFRYVVCPGSFINGKEYILKNTSSQLFKTAPKNMLELLEYSDFENKEEFTKKFEEEDIENILKKLDPDAVYNEWLRVGMGLHNWDEKRGLHFWKEWSSKGFKYKPGEVDFKWKTFSNEKENKISIGTLVYLARESEFQYFLNILREMDYDLVKNELKNKDLNQFKNKEKEKLIKLVQVKSELEKGVKLKKNKVEEDLNIEFEVEEKEELTLEDELENWRAIDNMNGFFNIKSRDFFDERTFDLKVSKYYKGKGLLSNFIRRGGAVIKSLKGLRFNPKIKKSIFQYGKKLYGNIFKEDSLVNPAKIMTEEALEAIERVRKHIFILCNENEKHRDTFLKWIAHQRQKPGHILRWAPFIQGVEGVGKSYIGALLKSILGEENVGTISNTEYEGSFNSWAYKEKLVSVFEEVKMDFKSRLKIFNSIKSAITDETLSINKKFMGTVEVDNVTNYIFFSNYRDAIPLNKGDRRFWIMFNTLEHRDELEEKTGIRYGIYFSRLFDDLKKYKHFFAKYFLDLNIGEDFYFSKSAPNTIFKSHIVQTEDEKFQGLIEVKELLERIAEYYNSNIISSYHFFKDFENINPGIILSTYSKSNLLKKLGYFRFDKKIKLGNVLTSIYSKYPKIKDGNIFRTKLKEEYLKDNERRNIEKIKE